MILVTLLLGRFFSRKTTLIITLVIIAFYVLLVGANPSVLRAGLMGALAIGGLLLGRDYEGLLGLEASAFLMTLYQPRVLWDIGFELSFIATLGLIIIGRPLERWERLKGWWPVIKEGLIITLAAEIMVTPLAAFYFHQISFVSLITNLLAVPALEAIMATGLLAVGAGWLFGVWLPWLAALFGYLVWVFLAYLISTVQFFGSLPFAAAVLPSFHPVWLFYYYFLLGLVIWIFQHRAKTWDFLKTRAANSPLALAGVASLVGLVWLNMWLF